MAQADTVSCEPVTVLFCCRPRSLRDYFRLRYQGMLPSPKWLRFLDPIIPVVSPVLETFILACLPAVLAGFLLGVVIRYNPPLFWMRVVFAGILAASVPLAVWWFWISPRNDRIEVHSTGFRWRISLARVLWFRCAGCVEFGDLKGFAYRTDCFERAPLESGPALGNQLARL